MTREEFTAEVLSALGGRVSTDESVQLTVGGSAYNLVHQWLFRAERRIAAKHDFPALGQTIVVTTAAADGSYVLSTTQNYIKAVISVRLIDGTQSYELVYRPPTWFDLHFPYPAGEANNKPEVYTVDKARQIVATVSTEYKGLYRLWLYPIPDAVYKLYVMVTTWPSEMANDAAFSSFGEHLLDHVILEYALAFGFSHFGEAYKKDAAFHEGLGNRYLEEIIAAEDYVPAYRVAPEGYTPTRKRGRYYDIYPGAFPSGVVNPWR